MPIPLGILAVAGAGAAGGGSDYRLIQSTILSTTASSVILDNIPQTFTHLQIRVTARRSSGTGNMGIRINGLTTFIYAAHNLTGNGSSVVSQNIFGEDQMPIQSFLQDGANMFSAAVIDLLDYKNTSKNKTLRILHGVHSTAFTNVNLSSGLAQTTNAVTSITLRTDASSFTAGSRFSLYGIS